MSTPLIRTRGTDISEISGLRFNESRSFMYTQLYNITSKYYFKTYYNGHDGARTRVLLLVCPTPNRLSHTG